MLVENIWIDLNKLSALGENSHTLNFRHVTHVLIRRNSVMLWGLLTKWAFDLAKGKKTQSKHPNKYQGVVAKNITSVTLFFMWTVCRKNFSGFTNRIELPCLIETNWHFEEATCVFQGSDPGWQEIWCGVWDPLYELSWYLYWTHWPPACWEIKRTQISSPQPQALCSCRTFPPLPAYYWLGEYQSFGQRR